MKNPECVFGDWGCNCRNSRSGFVGLEGLAAWLPASTSATESKLPPQTCKVCSYHNEYAGPEHLTADTNGIMVYVCRTCRPEWDRGVRMAKLKEEADEREAKKAICG